MARVKFLKDSEPYQEGDVVDVADDRVQALVDMGTVEEVDRSTPLYVRSVDGDEPRKANDPAAMQAAQVQKTADAAGRPAFVSGPTDEPVKGSEEKPEKPSASGKGKGKSK